MTNEEAIQWLNLEIEISEAECKSLYSIKDALRIAIDALERQIPKKLIETEEFVEGSCKNCKRNIGWIKDEYFDFDNCPFCGQAIDWSDEE